MPKYIATITDSTTWTVEFDAPEGISEEELDELAIAMCLDPDATGFDERKRRISDESTEVDWIDPIPAKG